MFQKIMALCSLILLLCATSVFAQPQPAPVPPVEAEKAQQERAKKALSLLDELLAETQGLKLPENRAYVQAMAADLLWEKDEVRARSLFQEAATALAQMMSSIESDDPNFHQQIQAPNQLRQQMLQMIARRDARLALEFLRSTRAPKFPEPYAQSPDPEVEMEQRLASLAAQSDPQRAVQIAEENLQKGLSPEVLQTIQQLQAKDPEAAARLTGKLIQKLNSEDFLKNYQASQIASSLLRMEPNEQQQNQPKKPSLLSEQVKKEMIEKMVAAAQKKPANDEERAAGQMALSALQSLMPLVEKYAPTQASTLRPKLAASNYNNPHEKTYQEFNQLQQKGTMEQMLDFAKNAAPEIRSQFYAQVAWKMAEQGDTERARDLINTHVPANQRRSMLENMDTSQMHRLATEGKLDEARRSLSRIQPNDRRAGFLLQLVDIATAKADTKTILPLLEEARSLLGNRAANPGEFNTQMQIISRFVRFDPERGIEMFAPFVTQLNTLLAAAETLDEIEQRQAFARGEMRLQAGGVILQMLTQLTETLGQAAEVNFERAQAVTDRFDRTETRVFTRLRLARKILSPAELGEEFRGSRGGIRPLLRRRQ